MGWFKKYSGSWVFLKDGNDIAYVDIESRGTNDSPNWMVEISAPGTQYGFGFNTKEKAEEYASIKRKEIAEALS